MNKIVKIFGILFLLIAIVFVIWRKVNNPIIQEEYQKTIEIASVDIDIETIISINCSDFFESFDKAEIKTIEIRERDKVEEVLNLIWNLKKTDNQNIDARAVIYLKSENKTDNICADRFLLSYKGNYYSMTDELRKIIWE